MLQFCNIINFICILVIVENVNYCQFVFMSLKKSIPNAITLLNLFSGCVAVYFACQDQLILAVLFTFLGIFFDFFDGFFARILKAHSELGLQLDSLADMVTSGVVPGVLMFQMLNKSTFITQIQASAGGWEASPLVYLSFLGFAITLASCYRLANFNIDSRQTTSFIGLPTPANTLLIISIALVVHFQEQSFLGALFLNTWVLLVITALSCYLLNAEIPLFALKFKTWDFKSNWMRYAIVIAGIILIACFTYLGLFLTILLYVLLSFFVKQIEL